MNEAYSDKQTIIELSDEESDGEELQSTETSPDSQEALSRTWTINDALILKMRANLCAFILVWLALLIIIMLVLFLKLSNDGDDFFSTETDADNMTVYIRK